MNSFIKNFSEFLLKLNYKLPKRVENKILKAYKNEKGRAKFALKIIIENFKLSKKFKTPLCQDTGIPVIFVESKNSNFEKIKAKILKATKIAYKNLRKSTVLDPLKRKVSLTKPFIYLVGGKRNRITVFIKGGGCENVSGIFHFPPQINKKEFIEKLSDFIINNGINSCPPLFVGIGIGEDTLGSVLLSYKALLRNEKNRDPFYRKLEEEIKRRVNSLGSGIQGWGGKNMVLDVKIEKGPSHIASLTVSVMISCHSFRYGEFRW